MTAAARGVLIPGRTALLAMTGGPGEAAAAVGEGADLVDLGRAGPAEVASFARAHPGIGVCAAAGPAGLIRADLDRAGQDASPADRRAAAGLPPDELPHGALLLGRDLGAAEAAVAAGLARERVVVTAAPQHIAALTAAGWAVLVDADRSAAAQRGETAAGTVPVMAAVVAVAAISSWLGAAIVATRQVRAVRRALDMTASIQGARPPAWAVRGLA